MYIYTVYICVCVLHMYSVCVLLSLTNYIISLTLFNTSHGRYPYYLHFTGEEIQF